MASTDEDGQRIKISPLWTELDDKTYGRTTDVQPVSINLIDGFGRHPMFFYLDELRWMVDEDEQSTSWTHSDDGPFRILSKLRLYS